ncbi:restriction endonuclease [Pasteurellaceae bacterium RH1A]|nr:restriction endonuclease [Pasteurellaceae bacterium RH1A]
MTTFNPIHTPKIYAYSDSRFAGCLKIGYTEQDVLERIKQQYPTITPNQSWHLEFEDTAIKSDGTYFKDFAVHKELQKMGVNRIEGEWFECDLDTLKNAILNVKNNRTFERSRTADFKMRPEQERAVEKTARYFEQVKSDPAYQDKTPHFLWNAKMRFGKTFASYQLAKRMNWHRVLILTFKPAVVSAWQEDLESHSDFNGWQFISRTSELGLNDYDKNRPMVYFASFQDVLGKTKNGGIKFKNQEIHTINWDCVIFDEYHYGAWRDNAKGLFAKDEENEQKSIQEELAEMEVATVDYFDEELLPITTDHYLYLSGTPFRAIGSGEFIEEQIFNWTYSDEQAAKLAWQSANNPYAALPKMMLLTYQLPETVRHIALKGEFNEFDLNEFFKAEGSGDKARFKHEIYVQKWLDLIRDNLDEMHLVNLKIRKDERTPMPFSNPRLLGNLLHTLWFLPNVSSCYAMANLLKQPHNRFYQDYEIITAAGTQAGIGAEALKPVQKAMKNNPLASKSITLTCGKLTTGISVPAWTGIFMLRNLATPETYFQAAFRVQTPWTVKDSETGEQSIIKQECYVFDFAPNRALKQIADYSCQLNTDPISPEQKVKEFIEFLPVLAYDGSAMEAVDAGKLLDMAMSGTTATLLARRWQSALLVNVDDATLKNLMNNQTAMDALMKIEDFRNLNDEIQVVINRSEAVKNKKRQASERELDKEEKAQLSDDEKKEKALRKQIQEKLVKFATRVPIFMYLSDYREHALQDVIQELEPELFTKVTGLTQADFSLLVGLNVFNAGVMNDAIYKFKRYEDASLEYAGIDKKEAWIGLYNTRVRRSDLLG